MKRERTVKVSKLFVILTFFLFAIIIAKFCYVALSPTVDSIDLKAFANSRNTKKDTIVASRGSIYDRNGEILAQDVNSYTVIAYLDSSRTTDESDPHHVVDKERTATELSPIINMTKERILELLNTENVYQVELGPGGRGLTELVKDQIKDLNLPGIDFISSTKRYYPKGDFLSYTIGYAKTNEETNIINGEMGIELYYNDILTGKNGYEEYEQDLYGYKIAGTPSIIEPAESGSDVYLTIDTNIQLFTEQAISKLELGDVNWATISVINAKTGEVLGVSSSPSFDLNTKEIVSYYDPFVSYTYEPGSVMKIFSFMAAMENGVYNGSETYSSGNIEIDDAKISDWNRWGWGEITFDEGFYASSNVAATILSQKLGRDKLIDFYNLLGFGNGTNITLPNEELGDVSFRYNTEVANASFGQGLTVTPIQLTRALTAIANDGKIVTPYIVKKITKSDGEVTYVGKTEETKKLVSTETVNKIKDLMRGVVDGRSSYSTGTAYEVGGYNVIGKTGTAQIANGSGGYLTGYYDYVKSFAAMFPSDDPEIIVYTVTNTLIDSSALPEAVTGLINDIGTYLDVKNTDTGAQKDTYNMESFLNKNSNSTKDYLQNQGLNVILIGNGEKVIKQYPSKNSNLTVGDKVFLLTNSETYYYPNFQGYSRNDITNFANLLGIKLKFNGYGYVSTTSASSGSVIDVNNIVEVTLTPKYEIKEEKKE